MENKEQETRPISQDQLSIIDKIIQSSRFTKTERDYIVDKTKGRLITTKDGSIFIEHLLAKIKFEKYFNGNKTYKKAHCFWCSNKVGLKRFEGNKIHDRIWVCQDCIDRALDLGYSPTSWNKKYGNKFVGSINSSDAIDMAEGELYDPERDEKMKLNVAPDEDPNGENQENFCN